MAGTVAARAVVGKDRPFDPGQQIHLFPWKAGPQFGQVEQQLYHVKERGGFGALLP